jgi:C-terminal processing protease CtpA/Prc
MSVRFVIAVCILVVNSQTVWAQALRDAAPSSRAAGQDREGDAAKQPPQAGDRNEPGYLGLITDDRRDAGRGIRVVKVVEGSPADDAGFRANDLIVSVDSAGVRSLDQMARALETRFAGDKLRFEVTRERQPLTIDVTLGRRPPRDQRQFEFGRIPERLPGPIAGDTPLDFDSREGLGSPRGQLLGVRTAPVTEEVRLRLGVRHPAGAVVVSRVVGSPAEQAGIPLDAVIIAVNDQPVNSPLDLARWIGAAGPGKDVAISFIARGEEQTVTVRLADVAGQVRPLSDRPAPNDTSELIPGVRGNGERERFDLLERRVRELERRLQELERLMRQRGSSSTIEQ